MGREGHGIHGWPHFDTCTGAGSRNDGSRGDRRQFILGKANNTSSMPTGLVSTLADAAKSALTVQNKSGGPALDRRVGNTSVPANNVAPMKVNSDKVVANLNADKLDGKSDRSEERRVGKSVDLGGRRIIK